MDSKKLKSTEQALLQAAIELIQNDGFEKLSVRAIAARVNCSTGLLYNYFKDMNELILKINAKTLVGLGKAIARGVGNAKSVKTLGKCLAKEYLEFAQQNLPFWNLLFKYKIPKGQTMPLWYKEIVDANFEILESALKLHLDAKQVHKASRVLWGAYHGIISLSIDGKLDIASPETPETLCQSLFEHYLAGLK